ncbi:hypothetical protein F5J12DRAFT_784133 [Pisolithus orientalis]|uniref:uncharacterized protein n=1 Tax=Pisolithus orientalis TaxID=936130 RepID=UPI002224800E|nr:uncharacterized protein F5J12DRAFT_784133 [Pisolithus orientalis]KAI6001616.1 hypothetical protein F5J12DRAFT_784133 [Pisolithus orientalis]
MDKLDPLHPQHKVQEGVTHFAHIQAWINLVTIALYIAMKGDQMDKICEDGYKDGLHKWIPNPVKFDIPMLQFQQLVVPVRFHCQNVVGNAAYWYLPCPEHECNSTKGKPTIARWMYWSGASSGHSNPDQASILSICNNIINFCQQDWVAFPLVTHIIVMPVPVECHTITVGKKCMLKVFLYEHQGKPSSHDTYTPSHNILNPAQTQSIVLWLQFSWNPLHKRSQNPLQCDLESVAFLPLENGSAATSVLVGHAPHMLPLSLLPKVHKLGSSFVVDTLVPPFGLSGDDAMCLVLAPFCLTIMATNIALAVLDLAMWEL